MVASVSVSEYQCLLDPELTTSEVSFISGLLSLLLLLTHLCSLILLSFARYDSRIPSSCVHLCFLSMYFPSTKNLNVCAVEQSGCTTSRLTWYSPT